jgi:hypothetical protein
MHVGMGMSFAGRGLGMGMKTHRAHENGNDILNR